MPVGSPGSSTSTDALRAGSYVIAASGTISASGRSSSTISAFAVILAFSSWPGLSIETRTSKFVTLSRSTPIGEICVTLP